MSLQSVQANRGEVYGRRARIGYICPPLCAEIFPYEFYKLVNVMAASQACIWDALRLTGVNDRIGGYGRLLREF
jgi:hypothetical protein